MLMFHALPVQCSYGPLGMLVPGLDSNESAHPSLFNNTTTQRIGERLKGTRLFRKNY